jgi:hypothetical protein
VGKFDGTFQTGLIASMIWFIQIQTGFNFFKTGLSQADIYTNNAQG